ncbi:MAG: glycosyltransferase family 4 protein [Burkholderiaceae bacterium]
MEIVSAGHLSAESLPQSNSAPPSHDLPGAPGGMRIAVVANTTWYVYNFRRNLMMHLRDMGHELFAVGPEDRYADFFRQEGIAHIHVPFHGAGKNPLREVETLLRLRRIFRQHRIDVVLSYTPKGNIYSAFALAGLEGKLLVNVSGLGRAFSRDGLLARTVQRLYQQAFRRAEWVFFQNDEDRSTFIGKRIVSHYKSSRLPGSGVDLRRFSASHQAVDGPRDASGLAFLFVARLLWDKGIGEYVEAARLVKRRHPDARFRVLGSIDRGGAGAVPEETLRAWMDEGLIEYLGACDDVRPHLASADCIVLPSFYREGVPRSLLEAAAMSRPVITTDAVGCRDTVDDQFSGLLCKPKDSADLAEKICQFIAMPAAERALMGRRAREKMERDFDERIVIDAYSALLRVPQAAIGQQPGTVPTASA